MKKAFLALFAVASFHILQAQTTPPNPSNQPADAAANAQAPYLRFPTIPPFHLLKVDSSTYLTKEDVKKNRKTIIMYFSPECEHCKHEIESFLANWKKFNDIELVMATYQPFSEMKEFNEHYKLYTHPNIKMGRDEKFFLPPFYKIKNLPYLALYDKKGNLITTFEGSQKVDTVMEAFRKKN